MSVNILKIFISETAGLISTKFHVQLECRDGDGGGGGGNMTKMAATSSPFALFQQTITPYSQCDIRMKRK